jgi:hypothetical protein
MNQDPIYAFQLSTFRQALAAWKQEQIAAYPHQQELIETVSHAMEDFISSKQVREFKMVIDPASTDDI